MSKKVYSLPKKAKIDIDFFRVAPPPRYCKLYNVYCIPNTTAQEEIERERDMRLEISGQYESYKVRVHGVLKQHKTGDTTIGISEHEAIVLVKSDVCIGYR